MNYIIRNNNEREKVIGYINRLEFKTGSDRYRILIEKIRKRRSINALRYQWWVFEFISTELGSGNSKEVIHDYYVSKFDMVEIEIMGKRIKIPDPERRNNTKKQEEFMEKVREDALHEFGILVPLPNEIIVDESIYK
jgi:hypothetical protein